MNPSPPTAHRLPSADWQALSAFAGRAVDPASAEQLLGLLWELAPRLAAASAENPAAAAFRRSWWTAVCSTAERGDLAGLRELVAEAVRRAEHGFPTPAELRRESGYRRPAWLQSHPAAPAEFCRRLGPLASPPAGISP